jgi:hypothetical protein
MTDQKILDDINKPKPTAHSRCARWTLALIIVTIVFVVEIIFFGNC